MGGHQNRRRAIQSRLAGDCMVDIKRSFQRQCLADADQCLWLVALLRIGSQFKVAAYQIARQVDLSRFAAGQNRVHLCDGKLKDQRAKHLSVLVTDRRGDKTGRDVARIKISLKVGIEHINAGMQHHLVGGFGHSAGAHTAGKDVLAKIRFLGDSVDNIARGIDQHHVVIALFLKN